MQSESSAFYLQLLKRLEHLLTARAGTVPRGTVPDVEGYPRVVCQRVSEPGVLQVPATLFALTLGQHQVLQLQQVLQRRH